MGSPVSVTVANLVMEDVEDRAISTYKFTPPLFWKRYVDDVCTALPREQVKEFKDHINSIEPTIKFTTELEEEGKLAFLDTEITHHDDGTLTTTVFRKTTHTDKYLSFESHHPLAHKLSIVRTLFGRAEKLCSTIDEKDRERKHITSALETNGYPKQVIRRIGNKPVDGNSNSLRDKDDPKATVVIPYVRHVSECVRRILNRLNVRTCFKPRRTLRHMLVHPKDPTPARSVSGVVYRIPCSDCDRAYIGQTGRTLDHRIKEHKRGYTCEETVTSAVAEHSMNQQHKIDWDGAEVIAREQGWYKRCFLESWSIRSNRHSMNKDRGLLPDVYNSLIF